MPRATTAVRTAAAASRAVDTLAAERLLFGGAHARVAGIDEAGRGALAGPVVCAICRIDGALDVRVDDSKALTAKAREAAFATLTTDSRVQWAVAAVTSREVDEMNVLRATLECMDRVVEKFVAEYGATGLAVVVDGPHLPPRTKASLPALAVIDGDAKIRCVAAASIIAKVTRDRLMTALNGPFPGYGFEVNKGYPTAAHRAALSQFGPSTAHRSTFAPVRAARGGSTGFAALVKRRRSEAVASEE